MNPGYFPVAFEGEENVAALPAPVEVVVDGVEGMGWWVLVGVGGVGFVIEPDGETEFFELFVR